MLQEEEEKVLQTVWGGGWTMAIPSLRFANFWINREFFSKTCKQLSVGVLVLIFVLLKINLSMAIFQRLTVQVVEKGSSEKFRYEVALTAYITPSPPCLPFPPPTRVFGENRYGSSSSTPPPTFLLFYLLPSSFLNGYWLAQRERGVSTRTIHTR